MSRTHGPAKRPTIGDTINPYQMFFSALVPKSLLKCDISDGAKLLYGLLAYYAGKDGRCFPWVDTLAHEMGVSDDTITRRLTELEKRGFIARIRRGPGRPTYYRFKLHRSLAESMRCASDPAELRDQEITAPLTPQICGDDPADLRCTDPADLRGAYKEEGIPSEGIQKGNSSSSIVATGRESEPETPIEPTTTNPVSLLQSEPEPIDFEHARNTLRQLRYGRERDQIFGNAVPITQYPLPDSKITNEIIGGGFFEGRADFDNWAKSFESKAVKFKNPGYGLLLADAKSWPDNRANYRAPEPPRQLPDENRVRDPKHLRELKAQGAVISAGTDGILRYLLADDPPPRYSSEGNDPKAFYVEPDWAERDASRAAARNAKCPRCGGDGHYEGTESLTDSPIHQLLAWCDCEHGNRKRAEHPDYVDRHNAFLARDAKRYLAHKEREREEGEKAEKIKRKASNRLDFTTPGAMLTAPSFGGWAVNA